MRIAIDARMAQYGRVGIGVYVDGLVRAIARRFPAHELSLITSPQLPQLDRLASSNVRIVAAAPTLQQYAARDWWEQMELGPLLDELGVDVYHSPNYTLPIVRRPRCATAVTLYDASLFEMPAVYRARHSVRVQYLIRRSARRADAVIFGSKHAARAFARVLGADLPSVRDAIYIGVPREFTEPAPPPADVMVATSRYGISRPYAIAVGTIQPRKNYGRLLEALTAPELRDCALVLAGAIAWKADGILGDIQRLGLSARVAITGFVETPELRSLIRGATMMVFPSLYEGFGIPPLEAFALGVPVCASSTTSIPEVVGDAAVLFDPLKVDEISSAMSTILREDQLRQSLVTRGRERLGHFTWERCAERHVEVYRRAIASENGGAR